MLIVVFDTLRKDHVGTFGYERDTTPTIDSIARDGLIFDNAIAQSSTRIASATFFALALTVCASGCGGSGGPGQGAEVVVCEYDYDVALIGDSITAMEGYSDLVEDAYPPGEVLTFALGGTTTEDWLPSGLLYQLGSFWRRSPRVASILLSTNDAGQLRNEPARVIENLTSIAEELLDDGACRVVVMMPPQFFFPVQEVKDLLAWYSEDIRWLCGDPDDDIDCGPDLQEILGREHIADGVHPNELGHAIIASELLPILKPLATPSGGEECPSNSARPQAANPPAWTLSDSSRPECSCKRTPAVGSPGPFGDSSSKPTARCSSPRKGPSPPRRAPSCQNA